MTIEFTPSHRATVGIEWELACVDRATRGLLPVGPSIVEALGPHEEGDFPLATVEFLTNTVELVSGPHARVPDAVAELTALLRRAQAAAAEAGADLASTGTHPFSRSRDQQVTPGTERYAEFAERLQFWGRQMVIWGLHVHVGVEDAERAIALQNAMLRHVPHLQALSASSPFFEGEDSGYDSARAMIFQQSPTSGLPPDLQTWADYEGVVDDLRTSGAIREHKELRWDVRPAEQWGTVEVRISDAPPTIAELGSLVALTQCIAVDELARIDAGEAAPPLPTWLVRENKWRAARYGLECDAIVARGVEQPVREAVAELVDRLAPTAAALGCADELAGVGDILAAGNGATRQRHLHAREQSFEAVVEDLVGALAP